MRCSILQVLKAILHESESWGFVLNIVFCIRMRLATSNNRRRLECFYNSERPKDCFSDGDKIVSVELKDKGLQQTFCFRTQFQGTRI